MLFGEPDTQRFLGTLERLKRQSRKRQQQTRQARRRIRQLVKKLPA